MKLSELTHSILDGMFGGTFAPPGSQERKDWEWQNLRFGDATKDGLIRRIRSRGVLEPHDLEVLSETWISFRSSPRAREAVAGSKDDERFKKTYAILNTICDYRVIDFFQKLRKSQRDHVSWDARITEKDGDSFLDREWMDSANTMLAATDEGDSTEPQQLANKIEQVIDGLVSKDVLSAKQVAVFRNKMAGKTAKEISDANKTAGEKYSTEGSVNDLYWRILQRLRRAIFVLLQGKSLDQAIAAAARNQSKTSPKQDS